MNWVLLFLMDLVPVILLLRRLLLDHLRIKYEMRCMAWEKLSGSYQVLFRSWVNEEDGFMTTKSTLIHPRLPLKDLRIESVLLIKQSDEQLGGNEVDGWYEDDNRRDTDTLSFFEDGVIQVCEDITGENNGRRPVGCIFSQDCRDADSFRAQIGYCWFRANLAGKYRVQYKNQEGRIMHPGAMIDDFNGFVSQLECIMLFRR